jgi:small-conductance mechanosensitive channel
MPRNEEWKHLRLALRRVVLLLTVALLGRAVSTPHASAQAPLPKAVTAGSLAAAGSTNLADGALGSGMSSKTLEIKLAEARVSLAAAVAPDGASLTNAPAGISAQDISLRRGLLQRLVSIYEQHISQSAELEAARQRRADLAREAQGWTGFLEAQPYSILLTDGLREEIQAERLKISNAESARTVLGQLIDNHRDLLAQAEERIRQLNEQLEGAKDPVATGRLSWQRDLEKLRSQVAAATVAALDWERQIQQERLGESRIRLAWLQRQFTLADAGAKFTQADLDKVLSRLEAERRRLESELAEAETQQGTALRALDAARETLRQTQAQPDAAPPTITRAAEMVEVRQAQRERANTTAQALRLMLEAGSTERTMWEQRFAASDSRNAETLRQSERRLQGFALRVDHWKDYYRQQLDVSSSQIVLQEARVNQLEAASELLPLARERLVALRERDQVLRRIVRHIERMARLAARWREGLREAAGKLPFTGRLRNVFSDSQSVLKTLWNFELFTAVDTITEDGQPISVKRGVTVGKIVKAILILVVGYWLTGLVSRVVEPVVVKRLKIEPNQASLFRRWLRVVLVVCLVVFSLVSVKIPLTVFAFAGGALAIGLGFGTQTLLKNFVSGIIILFERPFRVGDVLDVAGQRGTMTSIGLRASVLQLWDGTETLIPNSTLLENNLTNWTYTNRTVRFAVSVGVAYGSDSRRVVQLLTEVAERHGLIEKEPKPQVLFTDFGESALSFELRFWVDVLRTNPAQVTSDLRQMITGAFAEHGIVIAFPQRDLHLDTARPLQVEVVRGAGSQPEPPPKPGAESPHG